MSNEPQTQDIFPKKQQTVETALPGQQPIKATPAKQQSVEAASVSLQTVDPNTAEHQVVDAAPKQQVCDSVHVQALTKQLAYLLSDRKKSVNLTSEAKDLSRHLNPFSSWQDINVINADFSLEEAYINSLEEIARTIPGAKNQMQVLSLAAKNRAEAISEKSDFYPASIPLLAILFGGLLTTMGTNPSAKWFIALITFVIFTLFVIVRINTRRQVADLKIAANILDVVEKRLR